ncbi:MAG TPA: threo-3-hydroxy-L-aspartate ammonia-lyase [Vicinamibacterales bacterium]
MVTLQDVQAAAKALEGHAHRTPVMCSQALDERAGARVFLKCENLQRIGAFKFRGAWNAMTQLSPDERARGVIAYSSGNHAQAVARVGQLLGIRTTIVMPTDAPAIKRAATEAFGARIVTYDPRTQSREAVAAEIQQAQPLTLIPPFDHPHVIAGQGTAALELLEQESDLDAVLAPCGGGGLLSGTAIATKGLSPRCRVIGIEPELADDATRSFRTGTLQTVDNPQTMADGTRTRSLGQITFPLVMQHVDDMQTVTEAAIADAVRFLFHRLKLVVEPSGALGVAALLSGAVRVSGRVGVIVSGGNIDGTTMARLLEGGD